MHFNASISANECNYWWTKRLVVCEVIRTINQFQKFYYNFDKKYNHLEFKFLIELVQSHIVVKHPLVHICPILKYQWLVKGKPVLIQYQYLQVFFNFDNFVI